MVTHACVQKNTGISKNQKFKIPTVNPLRVSGYNTVSMIPPSTEETQNERPDCVGLTFYNFFLVEMGICSQMLFS